MLHFLSNHLNKISALLHFVSSEDPSTNYINSFPANMFECAKTEHTLVQEQPNKFPGGVSRNFSTTFQNIEAERHVAEDSPLHKVLLVVAGS